MDVQIAARAAIENRYALVPQLELRAVLRAFRNLQLVRLSEGGHFDLAAERGLSNVQRDGAVQVVFVALEEGVLLHLQEHIKIARRAAVPAGLAFAGEPQAVAIGDAGRNVYLELALRLAITLAATFGARIADDLSGAVTRAAG